MFKLIKNLFRLFVLIVILAGLVFAYSRYIEPNFLTTKELIIESSHSENITKDIKIAVFADTHFGEYYSLDDFSKVQTAMEELAPDIVIFAGDLIDDYNSYDQDVEKISENLAKIKAPLGKFAVFGNHDYGGGAEHHYEKIMNDGGFTVLKNQYHPLDDLGLSIIGIDDVVIGYGNSDIVSWARPDYYNIILSHAPDVVDEVLDYNADLMISGHTHGRQINLKFFDDKILPPYGKKYVKGSFEFDNLRNTRLYVNAGVGMTQLPYRLLSPPEVSLILLKKSN